jgi:hypothetical protein
MQVDLVRGQDGALLTLLTPSHSTAKGGQFHQGCRALVVEQLHPPSLARACGKLVVRASVTASDVPAGTGACGYDPASNTGMLLARRADDGLLFTIVRSGVRF